MKVGVAYAIHRKQIAKHGDATGVRGHGLFESPLTRPRNSYYFKQPTPDIVALGDAYAYGMMSSPPFIDGNLHTAFDVCRLILMPKGMKLFALESEKY